MRWRATRRGLAVLFALAGSAARATLLAQSGPSAAVLARAIDAENRGRVREAVAAYRESIALGAIVPGVLGLERAFALVAQEDSLLPALDTLVPRFPTEGALRNAQLRTLVTVGRDREAARAFDAWRDAAPDAIDPYRDYARVLLFHGRMASADSVLGEAVRRAGSSRGILLEVAQLRAGLGRWGAAAVAWREVMATEPYYEMAAVYAMTATPAVARDTVRTQWAADDAPLGARQALAHLEVTWGAARRGWEVIASLPSSDTTVAIWRQFAEEVDRAQQVGVLADVRRAIHRVRPSPEEALRAAAAALRAGSDSVAVRLAREAGHGMEAGRRVREVLPIELEALARMGHGAEAERVVAASADPLGPDGVRRQARWVAMAWIRTGEVERARRAMRDAPLEDAEAITGWLALYDGDLATARRALRDGMSADPARVEVLALLARTTAGRSVPVGEAYLALARGDTLRAVRAFDQVASDLPEVAPLALLSAARLQSARGEAAEAQRRWAGILERHPTTPEAAEVLLEWGRVALRQGDRASARARFEQLILEHPASALVPQARGALDRMVLEDRR